MAESFKILIIEDDEKLRQQVVQMLMLHDYVVSAVSDFARVIEKVDAEKPDLVILDINLPYFDGNYYCHAIRKKYKMPIIITSARNSDSDQILSMELGSDDYVIKPFNINVLMSRIAACLRRTYGEYHAPSEKKNSLYIDDDTMKLIWPGNAEDMSHTAELSKTEYRLMKSFLNAPGKIITREELLEAIWDDRDFVDDNTLTVNITRIKKKLEEMGLPDAIKTKRGVGYIMELPLQE